MNLKAFRKKHKLSQIELSLKVNISTRQIQRYEAGAKMKESIISWIKDKVENAQR